MTGHGPVRWGMRFALAATMSTVLLVAPLSVRAATGDIESGWFWKSNTGTGGVVLPGSLSGVPAGQFAIEYSGAQAMARTTLQVEVPADATRARLVVALDASNSVNLDIIEIAACPATDGWERVEGGQWNNQPLFDCSTSAVATYEPQGGTVIFDLVPLLRFVRNDHLDLLLTPTLDTSTPTITPDVSEPSTDETVTWRAVTLAIPGDGAVLEVGAPAPPPEPPPPPPPSPSASPTPTPRATSAPASPPPPAPAPAPVSAPPPVVSAPAPVPAVATSPSPVATPTAAPAPAATVAAPPAAPLPAPAVQPAAAGTEGPRWWLGVLTMLVGLSVFVPTRLARDRVAGALAATETTDDPDRDVLEVTDLTVRFGGITAVDRVSFAVPRGQILGLIGPNGAGKTTILDAISGLVPSTGEVCLLGADVTDAPTEVRCAVGLGRSFQDGRLFPSLTVRDTLAVALEQQQRRIGPLFAAIRTGPSRQNEHEIEDRVEHLLALFGLRAFANKFIGELSTGSRRMVDLACQVAHGSRVLLLDEPSSGIAQKETEALGPVLERLRDHLDCTIVIIEHDMPLINSIADRLIALVVGQVVADGTPAEVINDPVVVEAYLGTDDAAINRSTAEVSA